MKRQVILLTRREVLREFFLRQKGKLVPNTFRKGDNFVFLAVNPSDCEDITAFLASASEASDSCIVIVDKNSCALCARDESGIFCVSVDFPEQDRNWNNIFQAHLARGIKNQKFLEQKLKNRGDAQLLLLPRFSFHAQELRWLFDAVRKDSLKGIMRERVETALAGLKKRRVPKKNVPGKKKYIVDDQGLHFEFCHERHSEPSLMKGHDGVCKLNKGFRFGVRFEVKQHYNVTSGSSDRISGSLINCHGDTVRYKNETHLNVFPSSYVDV